MSAYAPAKYAATIQCIDCNGPLDDCKSWEPMLSPCACECGEIEHTALCMSCVALHCDMYGTIAESMPACITAYHAQSTMFELTD